MNYTAIIRLVYQAKAIVFEEGNVSSVQNKNPFDFVTKVDTGISDFLKAELHKLYPEVGFMTEEEQEHTLSGKTFILDPIDGTNNLVYDYKMSAISLAYAEEGAVCFGVVYNPFSDELFFAIKGKGAFLYDATFGIDGLLERGAENYTKNPLKVSDRAMKQALIEFGAASYHKEMADEIFERGCRVFKQCLDLRRACCTALTLCYIAAGRLDGFFEKVIRPWDFAAGSLILAEAGGRATDWNGADLPLDGATTIMAGNGIIHQELMQLL